MEQPLHPLLAPGPADLHLDEAQLAVKVHHLHLALADLVGGIDVADLDGQGRQHLGAAEDGVAFDQDAADGVLAALADQEGDHGVALVGGNLDAAADLGVQVAALPVPVADAGGVGVERRPVQDALAEDERVGVRAHLAVQLIVGEGGVALELDGPDPRRRTLAHAEDQDVGFLEQVVIDGDLGLVPALLGVGVLDEVAPALDQVRVDGIAGAQAHQAQQFLVVQFLVAHHLHVAEQGLLRQRENQGHRPVAAQFDAGLDVAEAAQVRDAVDVLVHHGRVVGAARDRAHLVHHQLLGHFLEALEAHQSDGPVGQLDALGLPRGRQGQPPRQEGEGREGRGVLHPVQTWTPIQDRGRWRAAPADHPRTTAGRRGVSVIATRPGSKYPGHHYVSKPGVETAQPRGPEAHRQALPPATRRWRRRGGAGLRLRRARRSARPATRIGP